MSEALLCKLKAYSGVWITDAAVSDNLDPAMRLVNLNGVMRQGVRFIRGVELGIEPTHFSFSVCSAIPLFKVTERYPWSGEEHQNGRRDMRRGNVTGSVFVTPSGTIRLQYSWQDPYSGQGTDEFSIDPDGRLVLHTVAVVASEAVSYRQVYVRKG